MRLFPKKNPPDTPQVQTCAASRGIIPPLFAADNPAAARFYRELRDHVPIIDAAIMKLIRLLGSFTVVCNDDRAQRMMDDFVRRVPVGAAGTGLYGFICAYFDQLLTYGTAVGEMVCDDEGCVKALYHAPVSAVELGVGENPLDLKIGIRGAGLVKEAKHPERILLTLLNPAPGTVHGTSILQGLPFVSEILMKIFDCVGQNFERAGNVRFAVTYNPPAGASTFNSRQRVKEIADEWSRAMRDKKHVCDFVSVGDVSIRAIGADSQILDCDVPVRHILEQIVSKLSVPPFLLGLSWSSTERMSTQQADILTSELEYYRSLLTPVIEKIARSYLYAQGVDPAVSVEWSNISLQDETELAEARLNNARAAQLEQSMEVNE
ncbi:serine/threonine protein phosphatase [uncultured Ruminococcus sp.]|uniref:serine/threonine protein phosphatase n=1 Tax=uncultured Ruminococcus sp. TaxID=165186 RepID=UPI00292F1C06|nr:serine/threonine protein phosphatase [uncultured Ruminococcus sp.]